MKKVTAETVIETGITIENIILSDPNSIALQELAKLSDNDLPTLVAFQIVDLYEEIMDYNKKLQAIKETQMKICKGKVIKTAEGATIEFGKTPEGIKNKQKYYDKMNEYGKLKTTFKCEQPVIPLKNNKLTARQMIILSPFIKFERK